MCLLQKKSRTLARYFHFPSADVMEVRQLGGGITGSLPFDGKFPSSSSLSFVEVRFAASLSEEEEGSAGMGIRTSISE